jgi:hypothetical protein
MDFFVAYYSYFLAILFVISIHHYSTLILLEKHGILNLLEPSGPVQACNGIVLLFYYYCYYYWNYLPVPVAERSKA